MTDVSATHAGFERESPNVTALLSLLSEAGVKHVVTGSAAARLHGVDLQPGDLDITPALDFENLSRLAGVLESIGARQSPDAPFGHWEDGGGGDQRWVTTPRTPEAVAARANWRADPSEPSSFDYLLQTKHGALDVVPTVSGTYEALISRASAVQVAGHRVWIESVEDLLATLTVPRRAKDRDRVQQLREVQRAAAHPTDALTPR